MLLITSISIFLLKSVLRHSLAEMLTGVTWQLGIVVLVLIEVFISLSLVLIEFHVIKGQQTFHMNYMHQRSLSFKTGDSMRSLR